MNLRQENSMLQAQVQKALADSAELIEKTSQNADSSNGQQDKSQQQDVLRLIEEYSRQNEAKTKELEAATAKINDKKDKMAALKRSKIDLETKLNRVESKLQNMSKFALIFIKSIKQQNQSLRSAVEKQKQDFDESYQATCKVIQQQINARVQQTQAQYGTLLEKERQHVASLQEQISS